MIAEPATPIAVLDASVLIPYWSRVALRALATTKPPRIIPIWSTAIVAETWRILTLRALAADQRSATISRAAHELWLLLDPFFLIADASRLPEGAAPSPLVAVVWQPQGRVICGRLWSPSSSRWTG